MARRWAPAGVCLASLVASGCMLFRVGDGDLGVDGHVYGAMALSKGAAVAIDSPDAPILGAVRGIEGCTVMVTPWKPQDHRDGYRMDLWTRRGGVTDAAGHFTVGGTSAPGFYDATLFVTCEGFQPVTHVFRHDRLRHTAVITVVREGAAGSEPPHDEAMQRAKLVQAWSVAAALSVSQRRDSILMDDKRALLRHFLAAIAYRTQKALRGAPDSFGVYDVVVLGRL
jgi:hypothetical protein